MAYSSVSDLPNFLSENPRERFWLGLDVHKRSYAVALVGERDRVFTWSAPANPEGLVSKLLELDLEISGACFEAGPTGFRLARVLAEAGFLVIVGAPSKVPRSVSPGSKTDRLDCIKLARFASKGLIRPIAVPTTEAEFARSLLRRRHQLADSIRRSRQRIRAMFLFHGLREPESLGYWSRSALDSLETLGLPAQIQATMDSHVRELQFMIHEQRTVEQQLRIIVRSEAHNQVIESLMSVPGVGFITAITFRLEIFEPERFARSEELTSYLGLAPTVRHSGQRTPRGRLVPVGQKRLRSLLVEAAWVWKNHDPKASSLYRRVLGKTGIPQKAIAAVARKLAIILWRLSIEQRAYRIEAA